MNLIAREIFNLKNNSVLLLDEHPNAKVAYSFRKLRGAYNGNCMVVARTSDNVQINIGFVNNVLDTASLLAFAGSGDCTVVRLYDQSGNGNDLATVYSNWYKIVVGGVLQMQNGKPSMNNLHDAQANLYTGHWQGSYDSTFAVFTVPLAQGSWAYFTIPFGFLGDSNYYGFLANTIPDGTANYGGLSGSVPLVYKNNNAASITNSLNVMTPLFKTGTQVLSSSFFPHTVNYLRATRYGARPGFHHIQELIVWNNDKRSVKTEIQNNINSFYGIY